jgi:hypothetical protein
MSKYPHIVLFPCVPPSESINQQLSFDVNSELLSYETTPKWHGFLMIKLAAFQASGGADTDNER